MPPLPRTPAMAMLRRCISRIAQPLPGSHPHLMAPGELTPGITEAEFVRRRERLVDSLPPGSLALFPAAPQAFMSHDVPFPHHQDTDLLYLSGLQEHSSLLTCTKPANGGEARWNLFVRPSCSNEVCTRAGTPVERGRAA